MPCRAHIHNVATTRLDHRRQVQALLAKRAAVSASVQETLDDRAKQIAELRAEQRQIVQSIANDYVESPSANLISLVRTSAMITMAKEKEDAYRSRDRAMNAVWAIVERHHELANGKCSCGAAPTACRDLKSIAFFAESFTRWERRQIELLREDKHHGLPENHPESRKRFTERWRWKGMPPTERDAPRGLSA